MIRNHGSGHSRRQHMGGTDRKSEPIRSPDGGHSGDLSSGALSVGEMVFADFFSDSHHDALPANHGAEPESDRDGNLHPSRNELGGEVNVILFVVIENLPVRR